MELKYIETIEVASYDPSVKRRQITFDLLHDFSLENFFNDDVDEIEIVIRKKIFKKEYRQETIWKEQR